VKSVIPVVNISAGDPPTQAPPTEIPSPTATETPAPTGTPAPTTAVRNWAGTWSVWLDGATEANTQILTQSGNLTNGDQFVGNYYLEGEGTRHSYCGARHERPRPVPCYWP